MVLDPTTFLLEYLQGSDHDASRCLWCVGQRTIGIPALYDLLGSLFWPFNPSALPEREDDE